jgi:hypothetical protein
MIGTVSHIQFPFVSDPQIVDLSSPTWSCVKSRFLVKAPMHKFTKINIPVLSLLYSLKGTKQPMHQLSL